MTDVAYQTTPIEHGMGRADPKSAISEANQSCIVSASPAANTGYSMAKTKSENVWGNTLSPNSFLEEYRIEQVLGIGGFGITYKAWDTLLETWVAIKEYFPVAWSFRDSDGLTVRPNTHGGDINGKNGLVSYYLWGLERFLDEARILARIQHPCVVRVKRYFRAHGTAYIVMDYEDGKPLSAVLQDGETLDEAEVQGLLEDVLPALQAVHEQGYLHRDIKPSNLYVRASDQRVMLIDFGAARQAVGCYSKSVTSLVTPGYSPPEQYTTRNDRHGAWTDIYALGAVLYRCVTGNPPLEAAERMLEDTLEPVAAAGAGRYNVNLLRVIDRALAVRPEQRFATIAEIQTALDDLQSQADTEAEDTDQTVLQYPDRVETRYVYEPPLVFDSERVADRICLEAADPPTASQQWCEGLPEEMARPSPAAAPVRRWLPGMLVVGGGLAMAAAVAWVLPSMPAFKEAFPPPDVLRPSERTSENALVPERPLPPLPVAGSPQASGLTALVSDSLPMQPSIPPVGENSLGQQEQANALLETSAASSTDLSLPVSASVSAPSPEALSDSSTLAVEQASLTQPASEAVGVEQSATDSKRPDVPPIPIRVSAPKKVSKSAAATAASVASKARSAPAAKAKTNSATGAATNPITAKARYKRGEPLVSSRNFMRQRPRNQLRARARVANSSMPFGFWRKWERASNPWEFPARNGFNQK